MFLKLNDVIDIKKIKAELDEIDQLIQAADFWSNQKKAQEVFSRQSEIKANLESFKKLEVIIETLEVIEELSQVEPDNAFLEAANLFKDFNQIYEALFLKVLFNHPYDKLNAIIEFHPGAGGTESQDWAKMLLRMYTRYAERNDFKATIIDYFDGDEAGIKQATLLIEGKNAYGYLKAESGVHRLVRISPFDASKRRHTSFAAISVFPEIDDEIDIEIKEDDLKIETFRSSGCGGQSVNTTDSAVRITHLPSKIVVSCQNERSQLQNRRTALKVLKGKLYQLELEKKRMELEKVSTTNVQNAFGSQIRSYVFHPYSLVKDHRTNLETGNAEKVIDGEIDSFIYAYLSQTKG